MIHQTDKGTTVDYEAIGAILAAIWAAFQAQKANKQTKATGNGFAEFVKDALKDIKREQKHQRELLTEHLADHAGSDLRK